MKKLKHRLAFYIHWLRKTPSSLTRESELNFSKPMERGFLWVYDSSERGRPKAVPPVKVKYFTQQLLLPHSLEREDLRGHP